MEVSGQLHALAALPREKESLYPLDGKLGRPQSRSERCGVQNNLLHLPGINTLQSSPQPVSIPTELSRTDVISNINPGHEPSRYRPFQILPPPPSYENCNQVTMPYYRTDLEACRPYGCWRSADTLQPILNQKKCVRTHNHDIVTHRPTAKHVPADTDSW
jgi:hypothetical protein